MPESTGGKLIFLAVFLAIAIPMMVAFIWGAPFVPTPQEAVDKMLKLARIKKGEKVVDPGCGDGRFVISAAKDYGAKATGYELFFFVYIAAKIRNMFAGFPAKITFRDSRHIDYSDVDVVTCYLMPDPLKKWAKIWEREMRKGARVVSYAFHIEGWKPTHHEPRNPEKGIAPIWVYEIGKTSL